jgi:serine/threonine protein kinase
MPTPALIAGRYELATLIGQGGMGTVYAGRDIQTGAPVAIKLLKADLAANMPDLVERFAREGAALRALAHPNIVAVLATANLNDQPARAAQLFGVVDGLREAEGGLIWPAEQMEYERYRAATCAQLDDPSFAAALAAGKTLSLEAAIAAALQRG